MVVAVDDNPVQRRGIALTISIVLHGLILLFFLLYRIITPIPPFPDNTGGGSGLELALGYTELGMGDNSSATQPSIPAARTETQPSKPEATDPGILTNDAEEEAPVVTAKTPEKPKITKPRTEQPRKPTKEEEEKAFKDKLNAMWNNSGQGSSGKGTSDTPGSAGGPTGTATGTGIGLGTGSFRGDGWSVDLAGRNVRVRPNISEKPNEGGKVTLDIYVDPNGKVTHVAQNLDKSTTTSQTLFNLARKAALQSVFYPDPKARDDQKGTMTFIFILQ